MKKKYKTNIISLNDLELAIIENCINVALMYRPESLQYSEEITKELLFKIENLIN